LALARNLPEDAIYPLNLGDEAVEAVRNLKAVTIVERDRPEGAHGRRCVFAKVDRIFVGTI